MTIELYKVANIGQGTLSVMPKPSAPDSLDTTFVEFRNLGLSKIVSLLEADEADALGLGDEEQLCNTHQLAFQQFPIKDYSSPADLDAFATFVEKLFEDITAGDCVAIHCRAGIGRSGMLASCLLIRSGLSVEEAFDRATTARGATVPETEQQRRFVHSISAKISR